ncbi:hypothetical protein E2C01_023346 [Portunus trituberculatus]|uniref:Uncharacterized protein n=1 Tax=Portunus trituberculatus TaxID=210409 RepID=A0A5B7E7S0_PORTR|nr:hypothetical protein [Portunus trituberculatus]
MTILMEAGLTTSLTLYPKTRPWFVSDALEKDLRWTVDKLREILRYESCFRVLPLVGALVQP